MKVRFSERFPGVEFGVLDNASRVMVLVEKTTIVWREEGKRRQRTFQTDRWLFQVDR